MPDKESAVLAIPEICVDKIIALYHTSLFAGHQGVVKTYLTMRDKFFIPNLVHYLRSFIRDVMYVNYLDLTNCQQDNYSLEFILITDHCLN